MGGGGGGAGGGGWSGVDWWRWVKGCLQEEPIRCSPVRPLGCRYTITHNDVPSRARTFNNFLITCPASGEHGGSLVRLHTCHMVHFPPFWFWRGFVSICFIPQLGETIKPWFLFLLKSHVLFVRAVKKFTWALTLETPYMHKHLLTDNFTKSLRGSRYHRNDITVNFIPLNALLLLQPFTVRIRSDLLRDAAKLYSVNI